MPFVDLAILRYSIHTGTSFYLAENVPTIQSRRKIHTTVVDSQIAPITHIYLRLIRGTGCPRDCNSLGYCPSPHPAPSVPLSSRPIPTYRLSALLTSDETAMLTQPSDTHIYPGTLPSSPPLTTKPLLPSLPFPFSIPLPSSLVPPPLPRSPDVHPPRITLCPAVLSALRSYAARGINS